MVPGDGPTPVAAERPSLWIFHFFGSMLVVGAVLLGMSAVLRITGDLGDGDELVGVATLVVAGALFLVGRWLGDAYRIHPRA